VRVNKVWEMLRERDRVGKRAKKSGFVASVDCSISLFVDPRRSDQVCTVHLPFRNPPELPMQLLSSAIPMSQPCPMAVQMSSPTDRGAIVTAEDDTKLVTSMLSRTVQQM
jgi:hypothetical protein